MNSGVLNRLIESARSTSLVDLKRLADYVERYPITRPSALQVLFFHLAPDRLSLEYTQAQIRLHVELALTALESLLPDCKDLASLPANSVNSVKTHWPLLARWIDFFASQCIFEPVGEWLDEGIRSCAYQRLLSLYQLSSVDEFCYLVFSRERICIFLRIWIWAARDDYVSNSAMQEIVILKYMLSLEPTSADKLSEHRRMIADVRAVFRDMQTSIVDRALTPLSWASSQIKSVQMPEEQRMATVLNLHIKVPVLIAVFSTRSLHEMLREKLIPLFSDVLLSIPKRQQHAGLAFVIFLDFMDLWKRILASPHANLWIEQALESNILQGFLELAPWLIWRARTQPDPPGADPCVPFIIKFLSQDVPPRMVDQSVFRASLKAVIKIDRLGLARERLGPLREPWLEFKHFLRKRISLDPPSVTFKRRCGNIACEVPRGHLQRCSGCLRVYFCSQHCQRRTWRYGTHREECFLSQSCYRTGKEIPATPLQITYMKELAMLIVQDRISELREPIRAITLPSVPIILVDHSVAPVALQVVNDEYRHSDSGSFWTMVCVAREANMIVVSFKYAEGHELNWAIRLP